MTQATIIIYSVSIATMFATISGIPQWFAWWLAKNKIRVKHYINTTNGYTPVAKRLKPFDCAECLSFWIAIGLTEHAQFAHIDCLGIASIAITFTFVLNRILDAFKR